MYISKLLLEALSVYADSVKNMQMVHLSVQWEVAPTLIIHAPRISNSNMIFEQKCVWEVQETYMALN
jgi:hypothetical protein